MHVGQGYSNRSIRKAILKNGQSRLIPDLRVLCLKSACTRSVGGYEEVTTPAVLVYYYVKRRKTYVLFS